MKRTTVLTAAVLVLCVGGALSPSAQAQPAQPRWELGVSLGTGPRLYGTYQHRYTPTLSGHPEATGTAGQDVNLAGQLGRGFTVFVTHSLSGRLGIQYLFAGTRSTLGGQCGGATWALRYLTRQPPDYTPRPITLTGATPAGAADGELRHYILAANVLARYPLHERWTLSVSGGLSVHRVEGEISPLAVTLFSEGGHATLFSETYRVGVTLDPAVVPGFDAGAELAWHLSETVSLALEARYFAARAARLEPSVDSVLNNDQVVNRLTPAEMRERAPLQNVEIDSSFGAVWAGIRYRF